MPLLMCPNCEEGMREIERHGVRIDVCPRCRGVWLDRGELEKLLDAAAARSATAAPLPPSVAGGPSDAPRHDHRKKKRRMRSFLDDLFDFDLFD